MHGFVHVHVYIAVPPSSTPGAQVQVGDLVMSRTENSRGWVGSIVGVFAVLVNAFVDLKPVRQLAWPVADLQPYKWVPRADVPPREDRNSSKLSVDITELRELPPRARTQVNYATRT